MDVARMRSCGSPKSANLFSTTKRGSRPEIPTSAPAWERAKPLGRFELVDPSFRALSGRHKFTVRRHKFNEDILLSWCSTVFFRPPEPEPPPAQERFKFRWISTLEVTQGQILSEPPTDATRFWWHFFGS